MKLVRGRYLRTPPISLYKMITLYFLFIFFTLKFDLINGITNISIFLFGVIIFTITF